MATPIRVTELPQPLTCDIDIAKPEELIRTLASSDAQMFTGFMGLSCCYDSCHVDSMVDLITAMSNALQHPNGRIVFSGCGTSGRLSHLEARSFNAASTAAGIPAKFDYLLGGGDAALLVPQEAAEDKPDTPVSDLHTWEARTGVQPTDPVVVVGISCGLSATYVGALLEAVLASGSRPGYTAVCVGFNPVDSVRHVKVDTWQSSTFHSVLTQMQAQVRSRAIILNPITGPESIAGSSRMKGGSMTKILLETACACALKHATMAGSASALPSRAQVADWVRDCYLNYERTIRVLYAESVPSIARLMQEAGLSLNSLVDAAGQLGRANGNAAAGFSSPTGRGRVVYLGVGVGAAIALIDASECTPTYGSLFNDVRGFVAGGWPALRIHDGDLTDISVLPHVRGDAHLPQSAARAEVVSIDLPAFHRDVLPYLGPSDLVLAVGVRDDQDSVVEREQYTRRQEEVVQGLQAAKEKGCKTSFVTVQAYGAVADAWLTSVQGCITIPGITVCLPATGIAPGSTVLLKGPAGVAESISAVAYPRAYAELALKLCLNAITTGAHVARGTIYGNRMVNVMCTNQKLFHRAVGIIADVSKTDRKVAEVSLVRAVYGYDAGLEEIGACISDWRVGHAGTVALPTAAAGSGAGASGAGHGRLAHLLATSTGEHVAAASSQLGLVPVSILLSANTGKALSAHAHTAASALMTVADAKAVLKQEPVIRKALAQCLAS